MSKGSVEAWSMMGLLELVLYVTIGLVMFFVLTELTLILNAADLTATEVSIERFSDDISVMDGKTIKQTPYFGGKNDKFDLVLIAAGGKYCDSTNPCICAFFDAEPKYCNVIKNTVACELENETPAQRKKRIGNKLCIKNKQVKITPDVKYVKFIPKEGQISTIEVVTT